MPRQRHRDRVIAGATDGRGQPAKKLGQHYAFDGASAAAPCDAVATAMGNARMAAPDRSPPMPHSVLVNQAGNN